MTMMSVRAIMSLQFYERKTWIHIRIEDVRLNNNYIEQLGTDAFEKLRF